MVNQFDLYHVASTGDGWYAFPVVFQYDPNDPTKVISETITWNKMDFNIHLFGLTEPGIIKAKDEFGYVLNDPEGHGKVVGLDNIGLGHKFLSDDGDYKTIIETYVASVDGSTPDSTGNVETFVTMTAAELEAEKVDDLYPSLAGKIILVPDIGSGLHNGGVKRGNYQWGNETTLYFYSGINFDLNVTFFLSLSKYIITGRFSCIDGSVVENTLTFKNWTNSNIAPYLIMVMAFMGWNLRITPP